MPLPSSGPINFSEVNVELGLISTAQISLNDASVRTLFQVPSGAIAMSNGYGKANAFAGTISFNQTNLNLRTWALANGWNGTLPATVTVNADVYVYSTVTSLSGLVIDGSWPGGITLVNNGFILGCGGNGGGSERNNIPATSATAGGNAISLGTNVTIQNNGYIAGGGGGGGSRYGGGGGGAGGGTGGTGINSANGALAGGAGGAPGAAGSNGAAGSWSSGGTTFQADSGGGGGRILPGTGGGGGARPPTAPRGGIGGGAGGGGGGGAFTAPAPVEGTAGGAGGSANNNGTSIGGSVNSGGGGGGGWGATGGSAVRGTTGAVGGRAIALNGFTATISGSGIRYGATS